ncbi:hypothetical protein ACIBI4_10160 [Streptomyces sp. NPDC050418]|uniref:effector-associated constant component EACC1 n=1 Tax=Streptomyces sp. NPDC050418 TaxID=3365612 RepID=UPI0037B5045F
MRIELSVEQPSEAKLLHDLMLGGRAGLRADGIVVESVGTPPGPGEMGGAAEIITLVVENAPNWGTLTLMFLTWREAARRSAPGAPAPLTARRDTDGAEVRLTDAQLRDPDAAGSELDRLTSAQGEAAEGGEAAAEGEAAVEGEAAAEGEAPEEPGPPEPRG